MYTENTKRAGKNYPNGQTCIENYQKCAQNLQKIQNVYREVKILSHHGCDIDRKIAMITTNWPIDNY